MVRTAVYYEFVDDEIKPMTMVIKFNHGGLDWSEPSLFIPLQGEFEKHTQEDYGDVAGAAVYLEDLTMDPYRPDGFSIHLPRIRSRCEPLGYEIHDIEQLIIRMCDVIDVMNMDCTRYYDWR
jgi:hypothetical protein